MTKDKLPPEIEGIREEVAKFLHDCVMGEVNAQSWEVAANILLSKLTKHGVVVLAEDQIFNCKYDKDGNLRGLYDWYKVVNLDGTPVKEG